MILWEIIINCSSMTTPLNNYIQSGIETKANAWHTIKENTIITLNTSTSNSFF